MGRTPDEVLENVKLTDKQTEVIKNIYYVEGQVVGRDKLYKLVSAEDETITRRQIQGWLRKQKIYQLNKPTQKDTTIKAIIVNEPFKFYQIDLIDYSNKPDFKFKYILTCIDVFSKKAYAVAMVNKSEGITMRALEKIIDKQMGMKPSVIYSDNGKEFGTLMTNTLKERGIKHLHSKPNIPQSNGIIESFNKTFKTGLVRIGETENHNKHWSSNIQKVLYNYNKQYHSTIKMAPNDVDNETKAEVLENITNRAKKRNTWQSSHNIEVGDRVRLKVIKKEFEKSTTQRWSTKIYIVESIKKKQNLNYVDEIKLKDKPGIYSASKLQVITTVETGQGDQAQ